MGTSTNQIATRANIDSGKRKTAYTGVASTDNTLKKCPTKGEINQIEFLDVKDNPTTNITEDTYWDTGLANWNSGSMHLASYVSSTINKYVSGGTPITPSNYENYPMIIPNSSSRYFHSSTSQVFNISFNAGVDDLDFYEFDNVEANALCYKTISVTSGKYTNLRINYSAIAYASTNSAQSNYFFSGVVNPQADDKEFGITIALVNSNSEVVYLTNVDDFVGTSSFTNISFTPTTSSITIYIIPRYIDASFYPSIAGNLYVGVGFNLGVRKIIYDSYYDSNSKLVKYEDIGIDSARTFVIYYGVWNNKSTPARVDYARAMIHTTPNGTVSGWTQIGQVTLSDIAGKGTRSGVITCTLPSNIDLGAQQYYLLIKVGDTLNNQDFYGGWGNAKEDVSYEYCRKSTSGFTNAIPLTPTLLKYPMNDDTDSGEIISDYKGVLNHISIGNNDSITINQGAYNTNSELKGWIKIQ